MDENFEGRSGSRHYSRWPEPWRREDDWGPITAAVLREYESGSAGPQASAPNPSRMAFSERTGL